MKILFTNFICFASILIFTASDVFEFKSDSDHIIPSPVQITPKAGGNGCSGNLGYLLIKNTGTAPLSFILPAGTRFLNRDTGYQDVIMPYPLWVTLNPLEVKKFPLRAYCFRLTKKSPKSDNNFEIKTTLPSDGLQEFVNYLNKKNDSLPEDFLQSLIWCISDNMNPATIPISNELHFNFKKWVCDYKRIPLPWYFIKQKKFILQDGRIHLIRDSLAAEMEIHSDQLKYAMLKILDDKGKEVFYSQGQFLTPGINKVFLNIKITHWPSGKYYVICDEVNQSSFKKEIEI